MAAQDMDLPSRAAPTNLKTPKGTRDWFGETARLRRDILCVHNSSREPRLAAYTDTALVANDSATFLNVMVVKSSILLCLS